MKWPLHGTWQRLRGSPLACVLVGGIVLVHVLGFVLLRWPPLREEEPQKSQPWLILPKGGGVLSSPEMEEHLALFDPEPLFLPTRWNYATEVVASREGPLSPQPFQPFAPSIAVGLSPEILRLPAPVEETRLPEELRQRRFWSVTQGFGQRVAEILPQARREAALRVVNLRTGAILVERDLSGVLEPALSETLWAPMEVFVLLDHFGLPYRPFTASSTGQVELDARLRSLLMDILASLDLEAGYYRIVIGP